MVLDRDRQGGKRHLVRTESLAHLRTQLLRVVADLKAQGKLGSLHRPERMAFRALAEAVQAQKKKVKKNLHLPASKTPITCDLQACIASFSKEFSWISARAAKDVAKFSPPTQCPDLDGLHVHRVSHKTHHHQPSNQARVRKRHRIGVRKVRPTGEPPEEDIYGQTKSAKNRHG